jgi:hypothetical protein
MSEMAIAREKKKSQLSIVQRKQIERRHGLDNPFSAGYSHSLRLSLTARSSAEIQYQYVSFVKINISSTSVRGGHDEAGKNCFGVDQT